MTAYRRLVSTAAAGAFAIAAPALAQPVEPYEYAEEAADGEVIYHGEPVVQPLPALPRLALPPAGPAHGPRMHRGMHTDTVIASMPHHYAPPPYYGHAPHAMARPYPPFDRSAWLANCRDRIRGVRGDERGAVIGGLLGAVAGGVVGNRTWDSERLAGTVLGAGLGGIVGAAIGSAIGAADNRRRKDECAWHLDRYLAVGHPSYGYAQSSGHTYGQATYGYAYGYPAIAYVPVLVALPQRAVVRETVTEEWVDAPVRRRNYSGTKVIHEPAPARARDKRVKIRRAK